MIFEARNSLRRWMTRTELAKRERKMASSRAESPPPPIDADRLDLGRKTRHKSHRSTGPWPSSRCFARTPSINDRAPVATMTAFAR